MLEDNLDDINVDSEIRLTLEGIKNDVVSKLISKKAIVLRKVLRGEIV